MSRDRTTRRYRAPGGLPFVVVWRQGGLFSLHKVDPDQLKKLGLARCPKGLAERVRESIERTSK